MTLLQRPALLALPLIAALAACADAPRYVLDTAPTAASVRLRVASVELREVVVPTYAEDSKILAEGADGGLKPVKGEWADATARGVTSELARALDLRTSASIAAEPWPLSQPADVRLEVRIERLVARADGRFQLAGQYAVAAPDGQIRDFLDRFDIMVPLAGHSPAEIAQAYGTALGDLGGRIVARLARR